LIKLEKILEQHGFEGLPLGNNKKINDVAKAASPMGALKYIPPLGP
jgi:hypothetical protein